MEARISLVTLGVRDLERSARFYEEGLGWKRSPASQDSVVFIQLRGLVLSLYPRHLLAEDAQVDDGNKGTRATKTADLEYAKTHFAGFTLAYNTRSEKEVDDVIELARKIGAPILKEPQKVFWGGYSAYFSDPDGYLIEVAYNPYFPMDENGFIKLPD